MDWRANRLEVASGRVAVHVSNGDPVRHTFTIDELHVSVAVGPGKGRRIDFDAAPGTYAFHCTVPGHEDMKGELVAR